MSTPDESQNPYAAGGDPAGQPAQPQYPQYPVAPQNPGPPPYPAAPQDPAASPYPAPTPYGTPDPAAPQYGAPQHGGQQYPPQAYGTPQPYGATPYGQPQYGGYADTAKNSVGVWALVLGILGIVMCGLFTAIPAIIVGFSARKAVARGEANNGGLATAGIILGFVGIGIWVVFGLLFLVGGGIGAFTDAFNQGYSSAQY